MIKSHFGGLKPTLLETIKIEDGQIFNLSYHQKRLERSQKACIFSPQSIELSHIINAPKKGLFRCRIVYAQSVESIEYIPYQIKEINALKLIESNINYSYKYANRSELNRLFAQRGEADDVLICQDSIVKDTSVANIAFYDGKEWFTPSKPLLKGTMRQKLLEEGFLREKKIRKEEIKDFTQVALMNAMIGFKILKSPQIYD